MFDAFTSLTGGGGLSMQSSNDSRAEGDASFDSAWNYKSNAGGSEMSKTSVVLAVSAVALAVYFVTRR